jgi:hypothetical protein
MVQLNRKQGFVLTGVTIAAIIIAVTVYFVLITSGFIMTALLVILCITSIFSVSMILLSMYILLEIELDD